MNPLPKSKVAAIQAAPLFLDLEATPDKGCALSGEERIAFAEIDPNKCVVPKQMHAINRNAFTPLEVGNDIMIVAG